jgi:NodT family efflux transporter outer membrane factor (OMF) lipoprotein
MQWWQSYDDPVLSSLVEASLANNPDIAIAAARIGEARGQADLADAQRLPQIDLHAGGGPQRGVNAFGQGSDQTIVQGQVGVAYDLDLFGRLASADDAAKASLLASRAAQDTVRLAIVATTVTAYLNLRALDARLIVLRDTVEARKLGRDLAVRRANAGYAPTLEARQAESDFRAAEALIPTTELAIRRQENALSVLVGRKPEPINRGAALAELVVPPIAPSLPSSLLRRRPDIAQAELLIVSADHSLDSARAAFMPNIQIDGSVGGIASAILGDPIGLFSLGGSILAPIFDAGRLKAQEDSMAARREQAAFAYRRTVLTAFQEVEDGIAAASRTVDQEASLGAQRAALVEALRIATNRYAAGYSPYFEQLDAQRALLSVDLAIIQARSDRLTASVALYIAMGGGWQPDLTERN